MSDPYLYHGEELNHHGFLKATINLRHGGYRCSLRILGHGGQFGRSEETLLAGASDCHCSREGNRICGNCDWCLEIEPNALNWKC